jgi:hypothetical protein
MLFNAAIEMYRLGMRVLMVDLDAQANLTAISLADDTLQAMYQPSASGLTVPTATGSSSSRSIRYGCGIGGGDGISGIGGGCGTVRSHGTSGAGTHGTSGTVGTGGGVGT